MEKWETPTYETIQLTELESLADLEVAFTTTCTSCTCDKTV